MHYLSIGNHDTSALISDAIYVRVLFIVKIVLSFTIDIMLKNTCSNPTIGLFLNCSYL